MKPTFILLAIPLLLAACGTAAPEPTAVPPTSTPLPSATPTVTPSPEPTFTPTPEPLTMDDVLGMDESSKLQVLKDKYPDMVEGNNLFCSEEVHNICVVDTGIDYLLFDVIQGEFVSVDEAGLALFRFSEDGMQIQKGSLKSYYEIRVVNGQSEAKSFIMVEEASRWIERLSSHPDGDYFFRTFWQPENFKNRTPMEGGQRREIIWLVPGSEQEIRVFAAEVVVDGEKFVQILYIDGRNQFKSILVHNFIW